MTEQEEKKERKKFLLIGVTAGAVIASAIAMLIMSKQRLEFQDKIMELQGWQ